MLTLNTHKVIHIHSQRICLESLCNVVVHAALPCLKGHRAVKLTGHCGTCQHLLAMLPKEQRHLLALMQHSPHKQVIEVEGNQQRRVITVGTHGDTLTGSSWDILLLHKNVGGVAKGKEIRKAEIPLGKLKSEKRAKTEPFTLEY